MADMLFHYDFILSYLIMNLLNSLLYNGTQ